MIITNLKEFARHPEDEPNVIASFSAGDISKGRFILYNNSQRPTITLDDGVIAFKDASIKILAKNRLHQVFINNPVTVNPETCGIYFHRGRVRARGQGILQRFSIKTRTQKIISCFVIKLGSVIVPLDNKGKPIGEFRLTPRGWKREDS